MRSLEQKRKMCSLFYEIPSQIKGKQLDINEDDYCNIKKNLPQIINYIKEAIHMLLIQKMEMDSN